MSDDLVISSGALTIWPQGEPGGTDDLLPDGKFGYLNEQVLWIRHRAMADSRSALRVPEGVGWKGKRRLERGEACRAALHHYQVGQAWRRTGGRLAYADCPISYPFGPSPGALSATVELEEEEMVRVEMVVANTGGEPLQEVSCHFCLNHRRAPLLGRQVFAMADAGWVDFGAYVYNAPFRQFFFSGRENVAGLPLIAQPALFSEAVCEGGTFTSAIGSKAALSIMSNAQWPCTDLTLGFGDLEPGESAARAFVIGLGIAGKDAWLERLAGRF